MNTLPSIHRLSGLCPCHWATPITVTECWAPQKTSSVIISTFDVTVADESSFERGTLTLRPRGKFKLNLWLLYRLFVTFSVRGGDKPKELHAIRVYPNPAFTADFPLTL